MPRAFRLPSRETLGRLARFLRFVRPHLPLALASLVTGTVRSVALLAFPLVVKFLIDDVILADHLPVAERAATLHRWLMPFPILFALILGANYLRVRLSGRLSLRIILDLRQALFEHVQKLGMRFHENRRTGEIISRLMDDVNVAQGFVTQALTTFWVDGLNLLLLVGALFWLDWRLALLSLAIVPAVVWLVAAFLRRVRVASRDQQERRALVSANYHEKIAGYPLVLSQGAGPREARLSFRLLRAFFDARMAHLHWSALFSSGLLFLTQVAPFLVFWYGGWRIVADPARGVADPMTLGTLTAFGAYLGELLGPINRFADLNVAVSNSMGGIDRVYEVFDEVPTVREPERPRELPQPCLGHVRFEDVSFSYRAGESSETTDAAPPPPTVGGITLDMPPGHILALVGPSGGGKSTLAKLLLRFYDVGRGRVTIDGTDIRDVPIAAVRRHIGYVAQEIIVFSGTVRDNILYGRAHAMRGIAEGEIVAAARAADAWTFIEALPQGMDTELGERGVKLSAGQRQRIALARLFLKDPPILVLDEATSALDSLSEEAVQGSLERLMTGRTTLVVAHRLSTIRHADTIAVIDGGRIVEMGTHAELVARGGLYAELLRRQQMHAASEA